MMMNLSPLWMMTQDQTPATEPPQPTAAVSLSPLPSIIFLILYHYLHYAYTATLKPHSLPFPDPLAVPYLSPLVLIQALLHRS